MLEKNKNPLDGNARWEVPETLYKLLMADYGKENNYYFYELGENVLCARSHTSHAIYFINQNTKKAKQLVDNNDHLVGWTKEDIDYVSIKELEYHANALYLLAKYHFGVGKFQDGVARVEWTLYPDGRYFADDDGFGMEDNDEETVFAYIDINADAIIPFQSMNDEQMEKLSSTLTD